MEKGGIIYLAREILCGAVFSVAQDKQVKKFFAKWEKGGIIYLLFAVGTILGTGTGNTFLTSLYEVEER